MPETAITDPDAEPPVHPWSDLLDSGLLWLINTSVLHPRGWHMEPMYDDHVAIGWKLRGNGRDRIQYAGNDSDVFARVQVLLNPTDEMSLELVQVNDALREFGIEYPLGARGVRDLISMHHRTEEDMADAGDTITTLMSILHRLVDHEDGPCDLDHHGFCQAHSSDSPCAVATARRILSDVDLVGNCDEQC